MNYERAGELYKGINEYEQALDMTIKAAECHEAYNALMSVAVAYSKASQIAKAMQQPGKSAELLVKSADYWGLSGDIPKYGEFLAKAAKEVGNDDSNDDDSDDDDDDDCDDDDDDGNNTSDDDVDDDVDDDDGDDDSDYDDSDDVDDDDDDGDDDDDDDSYDDGDSCVQ